MTEPQPGKRRSTWGSVSPPSTSSRKRKVHRWRCVKATTSKLEPGNALGNKSARRVASGETIVEVSREERSTLMGMVTQEWIEFLDPITQTMAWLPVTGLASDRRLVLLPNVPEDDVGSVFGKLAEKSVGVSEDPDHSVDVVQVGEGNAPPGGRDELIGNSEVGTQEFSADGHWFKLGRVDSGGQFRESTLPIINTLLNTPLLNLREDRCKLTRWRRRAKRAMRRAAAKMTANIDATEDLPTTETIENSQSTTQFNNEKRLDTSGTPTSTQIHHAPLRRRSLEGTACQREDDVASDDVASDDAASDDVASDDMASELPGENPLGDHSSCADRKENQKNTVLEEQAKPVENDTGKTFSMTIGTAVTVHLSAEDGAFCAGTLDGISHTGMAKILLNWKLADDQPALLFSPLTCVHQTASVASPPKSSQIEKMDSEMPQSTTCASQHLGSEKFNDVGGKCKVDISSDDHYLQAGTRVSFLLPSGNHLCYGTVESIGDLDSNMNIAKVNLEWRLADGKMPTLFTPLNCLIPVTAGKSTVSSLNDHQKAEISTQDNGSVCGAEIPEHRSDSSSLSHAGSEKNEAENLSSGFHETACSVDQEDENKDSEGIPGLPNSLQAVSGHSAGLKDEMKTQDSDLQGHQATVDMSDESSLDSSEHQYTYSTERTQTDTTNDDKDSDYDDENTDGASEFFSGTDDPYTDGSSYTDEDENGDTIRVHRRPTFETLAQTAAERRRDVMRIIVSGHEIGTELLPGQQIMARLGVAQRQRLAATTPKRSQPQKEFAPAVVIEARRGGKYYCIRYTDMVDTESLSRPVTVPSNAIKFLTLKYL